MEESGKEHACLCILLLVVFTTCRVYYLSCLLLVVFTTCRVYYLYNVALLYVVSSSIIFGVVRCFLFNYGHSKNIIRIPLNRSLAWHTAGPSRAVGPSNIY